MSSRKRPSDTVIINTMTMTSNNHDGDDNDKPTVSPRRTTTTASSSGGGPRLTVRIQRFHGVARWSWNANDDVCGICQFAFEGTAPGVKYPEDCPVVWGKCAHAFHLQCVTKWLGQTNSKNQCPLCRREWEFSTNPVTNSNSSNNVETASNNSGS